MCAYYMSPIYQDVTAKLLTRSGSVCLSLSSGKELCIIPEIPFPKEKQEVHLFPGR